jgi:hypothetical protein
MVIGRRSRVELHLNTFSVGSGPVSCSRLPNWFRHDSQVIFVAWFESPMVEKSVQSVPKRRLLIITAID